MLVKIGSNIVQMKDIMIFLDNENYRNRSFLSMTTLDTQKYFSIIDNEEILWSLTPKPVKVLNAQENALYFSFLDNEKEMSKYVIRETPKEIIKTTQTVSKTDPKPPVSSSMASRTKNDAIVDVYMKIAEKDFQEMFKKDNGLLFRIYLQKLVPLDTSTILNWGSDEMTKSAAFTNEVAKVTQAYTDIKAYDILQRILSDIRDKPSFWKKITGYETQLTQARLNLSTIKDRLHPLLNRAESLLEDVDKNANKITLLSHCLGIVSECAEQENQTGGIYQYLYSRRDTLFSAVLQANVLPSQLRGMIDEIANLIIKIDETVSVTIPTIELARANNV